MTTDTQTQAEFFMANAVDGELSPAQMTQMMNLPEGDTAKFLAEGGEPDATSDAPAPAPAPADPAATPAPTPAPAGEEPKVILAKDGVHTIPFEKLEEARNSEKAAKAETARVLAELEALKASNTAAPAATPTSTPAPAPGEQDGNIFGDYSDAALAKGIEKLVEQRVAEQVSAVLAPIEKQRQEAALSEHFTKILTAHPNMDSLLESKEFGDWVKAQPSFMHSGITAALKQGTADQVIEVFDSFTNAVKTPAPPASGAPAPASNNAAMVDARAKAAKAIADAKNKPPSSLSEIPGQAGALDESQALLEASTEQLMARFHGKTADQIAQLMSKVI